MCKNTIEAAALATEGVLTAIWDLPKDIISVKYDRSKTSRQAVEQGIAESGYDTENLIAPDEVYNNLPGCCRYERLNEEERSKLKEYATKHEQENLGNDDMYAYAMQLVRVYPYRAHGIATEYLSKNTDWKTKKNMELISLVITDYEDPLFTYMLNNREIFRKALDKKVVNNILLRSLIDHYTLDRDNVYWNLLHNKLKEVFPNDLADAERAYSGSRINHFIKNGKNEEFFKESDRFLTEFEHDTARPYGTIAYQFSMKTEDRKLLSKAYSWAKIAVKEGGDSFDNYVAASLAKKLDDTRRALVHANAALKMAKEEDSAFVIEKATALLEELDAK